MAPNLDEALVVNVSAAARLLNLSPQTVRTLAEAGDIPSRKIGKRTMIPTAFLREVAQA